jgi:hypothetical protein
MEAVLNDTYTDEDGNVFKLEPYPFEKGDRACVGCDLVIAGSGCGGGVACRKAPSCTPNNPCIVKPEWVGKHLVWKQIFWGNGYLIS